MHFLLNFWRDAVVYHMTAGRSVAYRFRFKIASRESAVMDFESFDLFAEKIITMPAKAIVDALGLDCKILEFDLRAYRPAFAEDEYSILCFRQFLRSAKSGSRVYPRRCLPPDHLELYKHTIVRLVHEAELPSTAMEDFEGAFVAAIYS